MDDIISFHLGLFHDQVDTPLSVSHFPLGVRPSQDGDCSWSMFPYAQLSPELGAGREQG